jgi:hypothetical protein
MSNYTQRAVSKSLVSKNFYCLLNRYSLIFLILGWVSTIAMAGMSFNHFCSARKEAEGILLSSNNHGESLTPEIEAESTFPFWIYLALILACAASPWLFNYLRSAKLNPSKKQSSSTPSKKRLVATQTTSNLSWRSLSVTSSISPTTGVDSLGSVSGRRKSKKNPQKTADPASTSPVSYRISKHQTPNSLSRRLAKEGKTIRLPFE